MVWLPDDGKKYEHMFSRFDRIPACDTRTDISCDGILAHDTIVHVYLTCSKKLTGSQLSLPHGTNKKLKWETKNKTMSMIGPVQSRCHEGSPVGKRSMSICLIIMIHVVC